MSIMSVPGSEILLEADLRQLECHHTWDLNKDDTDLNFLEVKFSESLQSSQGYVGNVAEYGLNFLAYVKFLQGHSAASLENLQLALQQNSCRAEKCAVTYACLAWVQHHVGDVDAAKCYLQKTKEACGACVSSHSTTQPPLPPPPPRQVLSEKAWALLFFSKKQHYYSRAKEIFQEALLKEPDDKEWNTGYAFALFRLEGLETREDKRLPVVVSPAVQQLKRAMALDPDNPMIRVYLGLKCYKNGRNAEAWEHMRRALGMAPDNLVVVLQVAKFMKKEQSHDMALHVLLRMLKRAPNSSRLHHEIGNNYRWKAIAMKQPHHPKLLKRCIFHFEEGARLNPAFIYPQVELALRYAEVNNIAEAERKFQKLFSLPDLQAKDLQACHRMYGDFHLHRLGAEKTAVEHYKHGMRLQNISTEWTRCRSRLLKIMKPYQDIYKICEFIDSFRSGEAHDHKQTDPAAH
ncbi:interferon-induced protein with tetratricopeptide repeats 8 [Engraulis encrasicolus]|uniref:interferon-induced protein with tetratricopeptide repeats 8 n=1 Tax=Engraulis encrasicolus TaxID=184585 RepID=UPI002FD503FB